MHPLAGVLSAYGMGLADLRAMREAAVEAPLDERAATRLRARSSGSRPTAATELRAQGVAAERIDVLPPRAPALRGHRHGAGRAARQRRRDARRVRGAPTAQRFGFVMPEQRAGRRGGVGRGGRRGEAPASRRRALEADRRRRRRGRPASQLYSGGRRGTPRRCSSATPARRASDRRARRSSPSGTHHGGRARLARRARPRATTSCSTRVGRARRATPSAPTVDPVMLEVFNNLFMSIAEQMGAHAARTPPTR